jgi:hypothetical protein
VCVCGAARAVMEVTTRGGGERSLKTPEGVYCFMVGLFLCNIYGLWRKQNSPHFTLFWHGFPFLLNPLHTVASAFTFTGFNSDFVSGFTSGK